MEVYVEYILNKNDMEKIINILTLNTIIENGLFKESDLYFNKLISLETTNNIEYSIKPLESLVELYINSFNDNDNKTYGYVMDERQSNLKKIEDKVVTLIQNEENTNYVIINEPVNCHNMQKLYRK